MVFDAKYYTWNHNRVKAIVEHYGHQFFHNKTVLDLGCGQGAIASHLHRMGAKLTCVDSRQENLIKLKSQYPDLNVIQADLDNEFPFDQQYDIVLSLGLLCHLSNWEQHLRDILSVGKTIILETEVLDSSDDQAYITIHEDIGHNDLSFTGQGSIVSPANIQRVLKEYGAIYKHNIKRTINSGTNIYDWKEINSGMHTPGHRRMWFVSQHKVMEQLFAANRERKQTHSNALKENGKENQIVASSRQINKMQPSFAERQSARTSTPVRENMKQDRLMSGRERRAQRELDKNGVAANISAPDVVYVGNVRKFVIVIASYNNERYCERNIKSALDQNYEHYRVIYTDDCSGDGTFDKVRRIVEGYPEEKRNKVELVRNKERVGALENLYRMIGSCEDEEIIITLDGDDWLNDNDVLSYLGRVYSDTNVWISYGQYSNSTDGGTGVAKQYAPSVIQQNSFRSAPWSASHLRSMYAWLFKLIRKEDLMYGGKFVQSAWDLSLMLPTLEMAGIHSKFISDILYIYNLSNPINDHKVDRSLQARMDKYVRSQARYKPINTVIKHIPNIGKVGLIYIATGKYDQYLQGAISSADSFFLKGMTDVSYFVFTDKDDLKIQSNRKINYIHIEHEGWPRATMMRYRYFYDNREAFKDMDRLYFVDVDTLFVDKVSEEIIGNLVGVSHCGFYGRLGEATYEDNPASCLYVDRKQYKNYYGGGFQGGKTEKYLELAKWCANMIDKDIDNNIVPRHHDETALNRYFLGYPPDVVLTPSFHFPQGNVKYYRDRWGTNGKNIRPKLMLLEKIHEKMRE